MAQQRSIGNLADSTCCLQQGKRAAALLRSGPPCIIDRCEPAASGIARPRPRYAMPAAAGLNLSAPHGLVLGKRPAREAQTVRSAHLAAPSGPGDQLGRRLQGTSGEGFARSPAGRAGRSRIQQRRRADEGRRGCRGAGLSSHHSGLHRKSISQTSKQRLRARVGNGMLTRGLTLLPQFADSFPTLRAPEPGTGPDPAPDQALHCSRLLAL